MAVSFNRNFNINRLVKRLIYVLVGLLVGGLILSAFITAFGGQCSPFFNGLNLIGINITTGATAWAETGCNSHPYTIGESGNLTSGILTVVGIIAVASVIMVEFVRW